MRRAAPWTTLALLLTACTPPAQVRYEERLEAAPPAAAHGVHAQRLEELMQGMDRLSSERLPKALDVDQEREWRVREVESVALGIADSAREITGAAPERLRNGPDARQFRDDAAALERLARSLAEDAATLTPAELDARAAELREACAACHRRFRPNYTEPPAEGGNR